MITIGPVHNDDGYLYAFVYENKEYIGEIYQEPGMLEVGATAGVEAVVGDVYGRSFKEIARNIVKQYREINRETEK